MKTTFLRVLEASDKGAALLEAVREPERSQGRQRFDVDPASFASVPRSPFAYWVSDRLRGLFEELPPFEVEGRTAKVGLQTSDDFRFVRTAWEVLPAVRGKKWFPFAKGGKFSRFYADVYLVVKCVNNFAESVSYTNARYPYLKGNSRSLLHADTAHYFRPGLTWPRRTTSGLALRAMPAGCIFADKGPAAFVETDNLRDLLALLAATNCQAFALLVSLQLAAADAAARSYEVGLIQSMPVPYLEASDQDALARLARRAWSLKRSLDTLTETAHAFSLPALLQVPGPDVATRAAVWSAQIRTIEAELAAIQAKIDEFCFALYSIDEADRHAITEGFSSNSNEAESSNDVTEDDAGDDTDENESTTDATGLLAELVSWAMGVAFGRFDINLATGARPMPTEPEPFDPLPICSPGMLTGADGLPHPYPPNGYPLSFPESGVLVDDPGHAQDLTTAVRAVFNATFGADSDHWWHEISALLDPKGHDICTWLAGCFFEHHLKRYSKSRRKAPIFWQLGTSSGHYSVWLYAHHLTRDTFFQLQNEVVGPKLAHEERQLTSLIQNAGINPSTSERKEIAAQEVVIEELRAMLDEVKRVAPLWNPSLDDGVVLTMAPLWRLVPQHKQWQKELKAKWQELAAGKYDWAHVAMHLWPERVVPKCASARSLAIAHGLEEVFWVEGADGKWKSRPMPTRPVDDLVRERSSLAVKAALASLLDAPTAQPSKRLASVRGAR